MGVYPDRIRRILQELSYADRSANLSVHGVSAAFECGAIVRFALRVDTESKTIDRVAYSTNGCGFMIAAAEIFAAATQGRRLTELHGSSGLEKEIVDEIGQVHAGRKHCIDVAAAAFRYALAEYRSKIVEEFQGEMALICTCFGVHEETILELIERTNATDAAEVSSACNAGSGCGSCRMLIQELIDARNELSATDRMV